MEESIGKNMFINSEQVGAYVTVQVPSGEDSEEFEETELHYLESGVGEPLLLVHSIGQSLFTWRNVFAELSENYRVLAVDLPGHGYSGRPDTLTYSMDDMADILRQFLDQKGIASAHMIGFSMGALYVLRFLSLYQERVANCIVMNPGGITPQMPKIIHKIASPITSVFARNLFSAGDIRNMLSECVNDVELVDDHMVEQYYEPLSDGLSREAVMYALRNFDMDVVAEGLIPVEHEVLVLWSKDDQWHPPSGSVYLQGVLQSGRYYLIRNTGHLLQEENPGKLLEIVESYIPSASRDYRSYGRRQTAYGQTAYGQTAYEQTAYEQTAYEQPVYEARETYVQEAYAAQDAPGVPPAEEESADATPAGAGEQPE